MYRKSICQLEAASLVVYLLCGAILLISAACTAVSSQPEAVTPPAYPVELDEPAREARARLGEQQWLLAAVTYQGEEQEISALEPTYFQFIFTPDRNTLLFTTPCEGTDDGSKGFGYTILFHEEQLYSLHPQDGIAETDYLMGTFLETSHYELENDRLLLIGDNNQIVLERVNTTP